MTSKMILMASLAAAGVLFAVGPALAHHSYAMFDRTRTVSVTGTVKVFQWTNPHIYLWVEVLNKKGGTDLYGVEGGSPNNLSRKGWTKRILAPGDKVTVELRPLKDGRNGGYFMKAVKADGSVIGGDGAGGTSG